eukprot:scaffold171326_cov18-Tisochrysis_lutea.AAC.1
MPVLQVWDLRARKCVYTIPGHRSLISSAHFEHSSGGQYIVTGGYDGLVKIAARSRISSLQPSTSLTDL